MFLFIVALMACQALATHYCGTQYQNLKALYEELDGRHWHHNNWFDDYDVCCWTGITCNDDGLIVGIDLSDMGLKGQIPKEIGCFPFLKSLYLNNNKLHGYIPEELCNDIQLQYLQLNNDSLHGHIPECICEITTLHYFYVDDNDLSGKLPTCLGHMTSLSDFHGECNDFSGHLPPAWYYDSWLRELHLYCNEDLDCPHTFPNHNVLEYQCNDAPQGCYSLCYEDRCPQKVHVAGCGWYYHHEHYGTFDLSESYPRCPPHGCEREITYDGCGHYYHECDW